MVVDNRLKIKDMSKLKITKIKDWAIYFTYENEKFILHESSEEYEKSTTLYQRKRLNDCGNFELIDLKWKYGNQIPRIKYKTQKRIKNYKSRPLNQININDFVWDMTWRGFFDSCYTEEIEKRKEQIENIREIIDTLQRQANKFSLRC